MVTVTCWAAIHHPQCPPPHPIQLGKLFSEAVSLETEFTPRGDMGLFPQIEKNITGEFPVRQVISWQQAESHSPMAQLQHYLELRVLCY